MLSNVLRSDPAIQVNIAIIRSFVRLRTMLASHRDLARKLAALERKYDERFRAATNSELGTAAHVMRLAGAARRR